MQTLRVFVTGGTGLIGRALLAQFADAGLEGTVLTRDAARARSLLAPGFVAVESDVENPAWTAHLSGHDVVVHLAGYPIFEKRWSAEVKRRIRSSRVEGTGVLVAGIRSLKPSSRPRRVLCASAVGYYGTSWSTTFDEQSSPGTDELAQIAVDWERQSHLLESEVEQLSLYRLGIVLSTEGGMLGRVLPFFKAGLGGKIASGSQWISWVHHRDVSEVLKRAVLGQGNPSGCYNLCAPQPVTNKEFTQNLAKLLSRPGFFKVPGVLLQTLLGEGSRYLVSGQKVMPRRLLDEGYTFAYADIQSALRQLLSGKSSRAQ